MPIDRPRRRESERLLIYLLLNRARQLDRQTAAFDLWPDLPSDKARFNLRFQLYKLADDLPAAPADRPWFDRGDRLIQWSANADVWLDVAAFESLAEPPFVAENLSGTYHLAVQPILADGPGDGPLDAEMSDRLDDELRDLD